VESGRYPAKLSGMTPSNITRFFRNLFRSSATNAARNNERRTIHCDTHGQADETFVCHHVIDGLVRKERVGFFWTAEDPDNPHPDAWCAECEERVKLTDGEWEGEALEHLKPKILCGECYEVAKTFHMGGNPWS